MGGGDKWTQDPGNRSPRARARAYSRLPEVPEILESLGIPGPKGTRIPPGPIPMGGSPIEVAKARRPKGENRCAAPGGVRSTQDAQHPERKIPWDYLT